MADKRFIYAGNRSTVLRRMLALGLKVDHVLPTSGSWLEREMSELKLTHTPISSKAEAIDFLLKTPFDVFVSTGFRFILPISQLRQVHPHAKFVNIHPSWLPDLRGADPIPGAILFGRDSGVTCHLMDDGIDTGPIISRQRIKYFDGLDAKLLYRLCFNHEPTVFEDALRRIFDPQLVEIGKSVHLKPIYYTAKSEDAWFSRDDDASQLVRRVRAFNTPKRGFHFKVGDKQFRGFDALKLPDSTSFGMEGDCPNEWMVAEVYEDCLIINKNKISVKIAQVTPLPEREIIGKILESAL